MERLINMEMRHLDGVCFNNNKKRREKIIKLYLFYYVISFVVML